MDRIARTGSPITPDPANTCFYNNRDPSLDALNLARNNANTHFKLSKWTFNEINKLKIKKWSLQSKLEELGAKVATIEKIEVKRRDHGLNIYTQNQARKNRNIEIEMEKMKNTIKIIGEQNNHMAKHNAIIINAMTEKLDKAQ